MGEAEWMSFAGVCEKNQLEFELFWCAYGGDERRKKKSREEREKECQEGRGGHEREEKERAMTKMPLLFFIPNCFIIDTASLIRNPNSKPKSII